MPKVPTYDSPSVQSRGIPNASIRTGGVSADAFGAGLGRAMESGGQVLMKVGQAIDQANEKKAVSDGMDASDTLNQEWNAKQQEFSQLKGKDAANIQKDMGAWYDKRAAEIGGGLEDERARRLFDRNAKRLRMSADDWAFGYQEKQGDVYFNATMESNIKSAQQSAIFNPTSENIAQQVGITHEIYRDIALRKGLDADWVNQNTETMRQGLYGDILKNAMQQDAVGSVNSFIEQYGDSIDPGLRGQAEKWVHKKNLSAETEAFAESLVSGGVSYDDAINAATEKYTGDDQDAALSKVRSVFAGRSREASKAKTAAVDALEAKAYKAGGWAGVSDDDIDALADIDAGVALRFKEAKQREMDNEAKGAKVTVSDPAMLAEATARLDDDDDDKFTKVEQIEPYKPYLTASDYKLILKGLDGNKKISESEIKQAYLLNAPTELQNKPPKKWTTEERNNYFAFRKQAEKDVERTATKDYVYKSSAEWWLNGKSIVDDGVLGSGFGVKEITRGEAITSGREGEWVSTDTLEPDINTRAGFDADERMGRQRAAESPKQKTIVKRGKANGRAVVQYSDGSIEYVE